VWPALAAGAALGAGVLLSPHQTWQRAALTFAVAGVTMVTMVPAVDTFFQFAMPRPGNPDSNIPAVIVFAILLGGLVFELLRRTTVLDAGTPGDAAQRAGGTEIPLQ
jgi:hypothetical protein